MVDEVKAAEAVVEAKVVAEVAEQAVEHAAVAAVDVSIAASEAKEDAVIVEQMAERAVQNATLDAEQRIAKFAQEMETCRAEIQSLKSELSEATTLSRSTSERLTRLQWLEEMEAEMLEKEASESGASKTPSETGGGTLELESGKTKTDSASDAPEKTPARKPEEVAREKSVSQEKKEEKAEVRKVERHRWL